MNQKHDLQLPAFHWLTWTVIGLLILLCVSIIVSYFFSLQIAFFVGSLAGLLWYFFLFAFIWIVACIIGGGIKNWLEKYLNLLLEKSDDNVLSDEYIRINQKMDQMEEKIDKIEQLLLKVSD